MKKLLRYLPLHFMGCLILGICLQYYFRIWQLSSLPSMLFFILLLGLLFVVKNKIIHLLLVVATFVFLGVFSVYFNNTVNNDTYYQKKIDNHSFAVLTISKVLKENKYAYKYEAQVSQIDHFFTSGKILVNIEKESLRNTFNVNDQLYVSADFKQISPPLNPYQFDYKRYLARRGIYQQLFIQNNTFKSLRKGGFSLNGFSASIRNTIQGSLRNHSFSKNTLGLINALLLGQRQDISKELLTDYANAGAIHILAVSGLHVGILLLLLNFLLKPLESLPKGKLIKLILIALLLWCFAFIAGLSASVVRAVTMFTFVAIGQSLHRKTLVEFSLIASAFLLLLLQPMFLFDVGFQLSYLAVFGIVWGQPKLYKLWQPKYSIFDKFWSLTTVSIAAQMGVLPLSLFYFHQFPGLFFLSNLVIIPVLGTILIGGIIVIITSLLGMLPDWFAVLYNTTIEFMNAFIHWVSTKEDFLFQGISLSFLLMIASYLFIVALFQVSFTFSYKKLVKLMCVILLIQGVLLFEKREVSSKNEFIVFHKSRKSLYGKRIGRSLYIGRSEDSISINEEYNLQNYKVGAQLVHLKNKKFTNYFKIGKQDFLIVDEWGIYKLNGLIDPIIILQNSPKINIERLIQALHPKQIIADGNNYKSYVKRWNIICNRKGIPFYYTGKKGAYILPY